MKRILLASSFFLSFFAFGQNKAGIFEYGNPSILIAGPGEAGKTDIVQYLLNANQVVFNEEEDHLYIRTNDDYYYFRQNPGKRIFTGWNLMSQKKENLDPEKLPLSREGRSILALFTPNQPFPVYRSKKNERSGLKQELWISADLKLKIGENFQISILDTNNTVVSVLMFPNPAIAYLEKYPYKKEKPKDYNVDLRFCYYAKGNMMYIAAGWGLNYTNENEGVWQYNISTKTLSVIPLYSIPVRDFDFYDIGTIFCNDYMIRFKKVNHDYYEVVSLSEGKPVAGNKDQMDFRNPLPITPLAYLSKQGQLLSFDKDKLNYFDKDLHYLRSFTLDMGKGVTFDEPAIISRTGKYIAFIKIFNHPEIGYYYSVNYDFLDDLKYGQLISLNDDSIHEPLIKSSYADQESERKKKLLDARKAELERVRADRELTISLLKKQNDALLALYNAGKYDMMLEQGDIWTTENADYSWEIGKTNMLNTATKFNFTVSYDIRFQSATEKSGNYVNMTVQEHAEAHEGFKLITQEDVSYGESYYKPATGSHTLVRNPNYRFGRAYVNFDKPEAQQFLPYLEKYTDLFTGNSVEIAQQQQVGIPVVVLKYPSKASGKPIYVYPQGILGLLRNHINLTKEMEKIQREIDAIK